MSISDSVIVRWLGQQDYSPCWQAQRTFTEQRDENTVDEIWLLEHTPVFTQGQNGKPEHILNAGNIPIVQTDRGGQVTYHGPGQLMVYVLMDLRRKKMNIRELVSALEQAMIDLLAAHHVTANADPKAPGVYVQGKKIGSIGLRVKKGCSFHGIAFNVALDLAPFSRINPCGFANLKMTQLSELTNINSVKAAGRALLPYLQKNLGYTNAAFNDDIN